MFISCNLFMYATTPFERFWTYSALAELERDHNLVTHLDTVEFLVSSK